MTRDELLKLLDQQCAVGAELLMTAERAEKAAEDARHRMKRAWEVMHDNERDRQRTMYRILEVSMGHADPGPIPEGKP